ncbi:MFS transporter [Deinococcus sp.]|uniref:MFS transporter n=1 Tax=Deinococcus sp. TaxID=47478 RepID=UPI0025C0063E|nr:MFS transporter [Deinococcus sp.]
MSASSHPASGSGSTKITLFLTIFIAMLGLSVLFPIIGPLAREIGLTPAQAGWFSTAYSLMQFVFSPVWGAQSEKRGRKPILLLGLVGFALSFGMFGYVAHLGLQHQLPLGTVFALLIASRLLGGILSSATLPTAQAMMADITDRNNRAASMGLIGAAFGLGVIFGPALGAALARFGLTTPVFFSVGLGLLTALVASFVLPETRQAGQDKPQEEDRRSLLSQGAIPLFLAASALTTLASVGMEQTISFFVQDTMHLDPTQTARTVGGMLAVFGFVAVLIQGGAMRTLPKRVAPTPLLILGLSIMGAGMFLVPLMATSFLALPLGAGLYRLVGALTALLLVVVSVAGFAARKSDSKALWSKVSMYSGIAFIVLLVLLVLASTQYWRLTGALAVIGIGSAILSPTLSAALSLSVPDSQQGTVAGLNSSALALGRMVGPLIGTSLYQRAGHGSPYLFSGAVLLALLAVVLVTRPQVAVRQDTPAHHA